MNKQKTAALISVAIGLTAFLYFTSSPQNKKIHTDVVNSDRGGKKQVVSPSLVKKPANPSAEAKKQLITPSIGSNPYLSYFDGLCPLLSESEEDEIIRRTNRSPDVLVALALLRSKRGEIFLKEAIQGSDPPSSAFYGVLSRAVYAGDRVTLATNLGGAYGELFLAMQYAAQDKTPEVLEALSRAASAENHLRPWLYDVRKLQEQLLVSIGRDPAGAKARALLEARGNSEQTMLTSVENYLHSSGILADAKVGPQAAASLLALNQQVLDAQGFDLEAYSSARSREGVLLNMLKSKYNLDQVLFLNVTTTQAIAEAGAEYSALGDLILFSRDKPGIYSRLPPDAQELLLNNISEVGEVAAFQALLTQHPEVFSDPDFAPQGVEPKNWALMNLK